MSIAGLRQKIRDFLARPPGPGMQAQGESLAFLTSGDAQYQNIHVVHDLCDMMSTVESVHAYIERETEAMDETSLQAYWQSLARNPSLRMDSQARIEDGEAMILAKNMRLVTQAYLRLGSGEALGHAEQQSLLDTLRKAPQVLGQARKQLHSDKEACRDDPESAATMARFAHFCGALQVIITGQLRDMDGRGRGGTQAPQA